MSDPQPDLVAGIVMGERNRVHNQKVATAKSRLDGTKRFIRPELAEYVTLRLSDDEESVIFEYGGVHWVVTEVERTGDYYAPRAIYIAPTDHLGGNRKVKTELEFAQALFNAAEGSPMGLSADGKARDEGEEDYD